MSYLTKVMMGAAGASSELNSLKVYYTCGGAVAQEPDDAADTWTDASGNSNDIATGPLPGISIHDYEYCAEFNGTSHVGEPASIIDFTDMTMAAWIWVNGSTYDGTISSAGDGEANTRYLRTYENSTTAKISRYLNSTSRTSSTIPSANWGLLVLTAPASGAAKTYWNDVLLLNYDDGSQSPWPWGGLAALVYSGGTTDYWKGNLNSFRIYDEILDATALTALYDAGPDRKGPGISAATAYTDKAFTTSTNTTSASGIAFNDDGTKLYILDYSSKVYQYSLSIPYDISTRGTSTGNVSVAAYCVGMVLSPDGTTMLIGNYLDRKVREYDLSTAWDITSATLGSTSAATPYSHYAMCCGDSGDKLYLGLYTACAEYDLTTSYKISGGLTLAHTNAGIAASGVMISADGTTLSTSNYSASDLRHSTWRLSTAFDISTATLIGQTATISGATSGLDFAYNEATGEFAQIAGQKIGSFIGTE
jgi:hypothetical protein